MNSIRDLIRIGSEMTDSLHLPVCNQHDWQKGGNVNGKVGGIISTGCPKN
jgi:hypothetical protein